MAIREVIAVINQMQADGIVDHYAIGGAVGATFYLEPVATLDVDVFVTFRAEPGTLLVTLQPIFNYLKPRGGEMKGEYIVIGGWPVQFLPPVTPLVEEALKEAVARDVDGVTAQIFTAGHLAAIALQTGRPKDKARLLQFIQARILDDDRFQAILIRHNLIDAWRKFQRQFLTDAP